MINDTRLFVLGAVLATATSVSHAQPPAKEASDHGCRWDTGIGPMEFVRDFGSAFVARDAPLGAVIGQARVNGFDNQGKAQVSCVNDGTTPSPVTFETHAVAALAPPPPVSGPPYLADRLLTTNVPGVAAQIEYTTPFDGPAWGSSFTPVDGLPPIPPFFSNMHRVSIAFPTPYSGGYSFLTLVKTGPIPPGAHQVLPQVLFTGSFSEVGMALTYAITGMVIQAQCDVGASTPAYVELGEWNRSHFTAPGATTTEVPFALELENCADDPDNGATDIYVQFDPQRGSQPVDAVNGVFSLTSTSTAKGVGIQILKGDGSPMALNNIVQMHRVPGSGSTQLPFQVRFYQTDAPEAVVAGNAEGFLGFTISYL